MTLSSRLLPLLFQRPDLDRGLRVLDVGPAVPETVEFFSQFKCQLFFLDLYSEQLVHHPPEDMSVTEIQALFAELMHFPKEIRFDICLFWDFLNYLDASCLEAFAKALRPHLHRNTRGHGFGVLNAKTTLENNLYGILNSEQLCTKPCRERALTCYPRPQRELNNLLCGFDISRSTLMLDRRLEIFLQSDVQADTDFLS